MRLASPWSHKHTRVLWPTCPHKLTEPLTPPCQVLEFGSGTGALAARLAQAGVRVVCTDCGKQVDYVRQRMDGVAGTSVLQLDWGTQG
jgi:cyclopropane fatty-acyl-phospholipid synthase-like methyltransferase